MMRALLALAALSTPALANPYEPIANAVIASFKPGFDRVAALKDSYQVLRLMDARGAFTVKQLAGKGLEADFDPRAFVQRMVTCAAQNPYLTAFVQEASGKSFAFARHPDRDAVLARATTYAVALDRLTKVAYDDWRILEALKQRFAQVETGTFGKKFRHVGTFFGRVKQISIDVVMKNWIDFHKARKVPYDHGRVLLPVNIAEAVLEDMRLGYKDNARAGVTLTFNRPGKKTLDPKTHAGPTRFTPDKKAILCAPPLPRQWADLYSTWNLGFVSHYPNAPFFFAKLLTPQVGCYHGRPEGYIYNRVIALYLQIRHERYTLVDRESPKAWSPPKMDWTDKAFSQAWGKSNRASAKRYEADLDKVHKGWHAVAVKEAAEMKKVLRELGGGVSDMVKLIAHR